MNTSLAWPAPVIDLSDRDYFKWAQQDSGAPIFISIPAISRTSGDWSFFLARRIEGASGEFIGLVLSAIDIRYLEDFFRAISLHNGGSVAAFRRDGTMLARFPAVENMAGGKLLVGLLGVALAFAPTVIYPFYAHQPSYWGLSPLEDQMMAGLVMALEQSVVRNLTL